MSLGRLGCFFFPAGVSSASRVALSAVAATPSSEALQAGRGYRHPLTKPSQKQPQVTKGNKKSTTHAGRATILIVCGRGVGVVATTLPPQSALIHPTAYPRPTGKKEKKKKKKQHTTGPGAWGPSTEACTRYGQLGGVQTYRESAAVSRTAW